MPNPTKTILPTRAPTGAGGVRIERVAERQIRLPDPGDLQGVVGAEGGRQQIEAVEVGAVGPHRREAVPGEPRGDEVGRDPVPGGVRQPALQAVSGEKPDVRLQVAGPDRSAARRGGRVLRHHRRRDQDRRRRRRCPADCHAAHCTAVTAHGGAFVPTTRRRRESPTLSAGLGPRPGVGAVERRRLRRRRRLPGGSPGR